MRFPLSLAHSFMPLTPALQGAQDTLHRTLIIRIANYCKRELVDVYSESPTQIAQNFYNAMNCILYHPPETN